MIRTCGIPLSTGNVSARMASTLGLPQSTPHPMKALLLPSAAIAALAAASLSHDTSGPYVDSLGNVYDSLPAPSDYPSFAAFDARFGTEVFTTRDGHRFQIDRELTPQEIADNLALQQLMQNWRFFQGSGNNVRASVSTNNPCDEEFRANFPTTNDLRNFVVSTVSSSESQMLSAWGIDLVPTKGALWDSADSADIVGLLDEAFREHGYAGTDMMNAWSDDPTSGGAIGVAYLGLPRALVKEYQTFEANIHEHEVGHTYTLNHCCDGNCTMQAVLDVGAFHGFHNYVENCSGQNHTSVMNNQKNRY